MTLPARQATGAFQRIPMVPPAEEHLASALRRARRVGGNAKLRNEAARARNRAARQMDELTREISAPLGAIARGFPAPARLHPFEAALLELTIGAANYERRLARVDALRRSAVEVRPGLRALRVPCGLHALQPYAVDAPRFCTVGARPVRRAQHLRPAGSRGRPTAGRATAVATNAPCTSARPLQRGRGALPSWAGDD
jgi:hypothetical protein